MKVLFVYSGNSSTGKNNIIENQVASLRAKGVHIDLYPIKGKGVKGYYSSIKLIKTHIIGSHYDIIHAHYGLSAVAALLAKKNLPLIVSFMGDDLVGSNRKDGTVKLWSKILIIINSYLAKYFYDFTIVKSEEMSKSLLKKTRHIIIPNGVDIKSFYFINKKVARDTLGFKDNERIALFVSNPSRAEKNFLLAEKSVEGITDFTIILKVASNLPQEVLNLYYNSSDLMLLTSFHEGSPNVIKEAMACNCPIVSTDVGDVKWVFGNESGCYISTFDKTDVSEKIRLAVEYRKSHGQTSGRERIIGLGLDSETIAHRIIDVYKKVLLKDN